MANSKYRQKVAIFTERGRSESLLTMYLIFICLGEVGDESFGRFGDAKTHNIKTFREGTNTSNLVHTADDYLIYFPKSDRLAWYVCGTSSRCLHFFCPPSIFASRAKAVCEIMHADMKKERR